MPTLQEMLANALAVAKKAAVGGRIVRTQDLNRADRERLIKAGWLTPITRGWYLLSQPGTGGERVAWTGAYWHFVSSYLGDRLGDGYCLSADSSLDHWLNQASVPRQLGVMNTRGVGDKLDWPHETSCILWTAQTLPPNQPDAVGARVMPLPWALVRAAPAVWDRQPLDMQAALTSIRTADELAQPLVAGNHVAVAGKIIGAYRALKNDAMADEIRQKVDAAGMRGIVEANPFVAAPVVLGPRYHRSPYAARIEGLWKKGREAVIAEFPKPPGTPKDVEATLKRVQETYVHDAYNSLSIEGYEVSEELIERVKSGTWAPDANAGDRDQRNALAARGYFEAYEQICDDLEEMLQGKPAGEIAAKGLHRWYELLFEPAVKAGIHRRQDLIGWRTHPVYLRVGKHVPPPHDALTDAMAIFDECLTSEPHPAVRAVMGHAILTYIHPFMDGNGRTARFLMNTQLVSAGYPWTIIKNDAGKMRYFAALDAISTDQDSRKIASFIHEAMKVDWSAAPAPDGAAAPLPDMGPG